MDTTIRWLHLTDLHVGMDDQDWLWPRMQSKFREDLTTIHPTAGPWDLVLFTGDLVQKGTEYAQLEEIFGEIWRWFEELQPGHPPQLLAVPGNHDLQWRDAKDPVVRMLHKWATDADVRDGFWKQPDGKYRQTVKDAFAGYEKWWQATPRKPDGITAGTLPGDFSCTFTKAGFRLGIVGLNSAFLQLTEKKGGRNYEGHLAVDPRQLQAACGGNGVKWAESPDACFLMPHHPPQWLNTESRDNLNREVIESFCLHLCGHNHQTQVLQELTGGADIAPLRWLGRSLFGLEKARNGRLDRSHGYVAGELRWNEDDSGQLQFMPRQRAEQGNRWRLVPDQSVVLPIQNERTCEFPVRLRRVRAETNPSPVRVALSPAEEAEATHVTDLANLDVADDESAREPVSSAAPQIDQDDVSDDVSTVAERKGPNRKAAFIANELLQAVCKQLNSDEETFRTLRGQLIKRLSEEGRHDPTEADAKFLVQALTKKLNEVLDTLRRWLDSTDRIEDGGQVRRLIDAVGTAGFEAAWIAELAAERDAGHVHVPVETDLYLCEVILTAIYGEPATWSRDRRIDHGDILAIATPSTMPKARAREIRRRIVETYFKDRISREVGESDADYEQRLDRWAERDLPAVLEDEREYRKPWFVLFLGTVDALKRDMGIDPDLWSQILKLERSDQQDHFVFDRAKLQGRLAAMHQRLEELDAKTRTRPRR